MYPLWTLQLCWSWAGCERVASCLPSHLRRETLCQGLQSSRNGFRHPGRNDRPDCKVLNQGPMSLTNYSIATNWWNEALWLDIESHMTSFNKIKCFISALLMTHVYVDSNRDCSSSCSWWKMSPSSCFYFISESWNPLNEYLMLKVTSTDPQKVFSCTIVSPFDKKLGPLKCIIFNGPNPASFYFHSFLKTMTNIVQFGYKWKKHRWWCSWDLNPGPLDGRWRQFNWSKASPFKNIFNTVFALHFASQIDGVFGSYQLVLGQLWIVYTLSICVLCCVQL